MIRQEEVYKIGRLGKPHGVKGEIQLQFTDDVFDRVDAEYLVLSIDGILVPFFMEEYRFRSDEMALIKFCDIDSQEQASQITGCEVYFPVKLSDSTDEELSWGEIIGYQLIDEATGNHIGAIASVDDSTQNVLFCLEDDTLIPAHPDWIKDIDRTKRTIRVCLPEGLLELTADAEDGEDSDESDVSDNDSAQ